MEHRLSAILSADASGYTRLLAEDQPSTIRALAEAREQIAKSVDQHRGRVVDSPGDNVLAELPSALDALRCAVSVQRALADRAAPVSPERRLLYRIGLHLGDIAFDAGRIYGDGVNVAARLQTLAEPGGICLSTAIHDNVAGRIDLPFEDIGEQSLKNFPRPVRAFRLGGDAPPTREVTSPEPPDQPSLVVLPFVNLSGDLEQEYFADGMSEDLIAELARVPGLFVIGRSTSFSYKGRNVASREVGRDLGVRHVVEGSVRRGGARVRITARLTEASSGREIWSERYDRELVDVFALQDEVVGGVVAELRRTLGAGIDHTPRDRPVGVDVWGLLVQGRSLVDVNSRESVLQGRELLERCVALDPGFALGWAHLARSEYHLWLTGSEPDGDLELGLTRAERAIGLDPCEATGHAVRGMALALMLRGDEAVEAVRRALDLAPGRPEIQLWAGQILNHAGRHAEAIPVLKATTRLDPALRYMHLFQLGISYNQQGRHDEAIAKHRECVQERPDFFGAHMQLAAIHANLGYLNQARASLGDVLRLRPEFSIARIPRVPQRRDALVAAFRKLGLKEE